MISRSGMVADPQHWGDSDGVSGTLRLSLRETSRRAGMHGRRACWWMAPGTWSSMYERGVPSLERYWPKAGRHRGAARTRWHTLYPTALVWFVIKPQAPGIVVERERAHPRQMLSGRTVERAIIARTVTHSDVVLAVRSAPTLISTPISARLAEAGLRSIWRGSFDDRFQSRHLEAPHLSLTQRSTLRVEISRARDRGRTGSPRWRWRAPEGLE